MNYLIDDQIAYPRIVVQSLDGHDEWLALQQSKCEAHVEEYRMGGHANRRHNETWMALLEERQNGTKA